MLRLVLLLLATPLLAHDGDLDVHTWGPSPIPDRIILTWTGDPATSQAVTWRTSPDADDPIAEIAPATPVPSYSSGDGVNEGFTARAITVTAKTTILEAGLGTAHYHSAEFTGLTPETLYAYRVGDGEHWSEWFHFRTASAEPKPTTFLYVGDAQNAVKSFWSRLIRQAYVQVPEAAFIIHAGDLINHANHDDEWGEWHYASGWRNGMLPSIPTPGNHEYAKNALGQRRDLSVHWRPGFALPTHGPKGLRETVYYIDYQGIRIISLNSNEKEEDQVAWLDSVLTNNPNRWTVLTFHHPMFSAAEGRDNPQLRKHWLPIIDKHKVDLVLQGHDHTYGRSGNVAEGTTMRDADRGTVYVVSVSGPKMYRSQEHPLMRRLAEDTQLFQAIHIDGTRLTYRAYTATGELYDAFDLRKQADGTNRLIELPPDVPERRRR